MELELELDEALLLSMVRRAVVLEETGRPEEALPLYEQAYAAFKAAGQQRGKLVRRIINCRCRLSGGRVFHHFRHLSYTFERRQLGGIGFQFIRYTVSVCGCFCRHRRHCAGLRACRHSS